ncbi:MAG: outer membrane lipoprotein-sorting protein [candidate division Zixibacteria bacterium]|nr:outer membrane lipoprotein-sorting protein [candidate division Zixibacteria bacterium]
MTIRLRQLLIIAIAAVIVPVSAQAECSPDSVLTLLRENVDSYDIIHVNYHREIHSVLFGEREPEDGTLWISPPHRYRVETKGQVYVRGEDTLWTYSEATDQVTIRTGDLSKAEFGPAGFFGSLQDDFLLVGCSTDPIGDFDCWKVRLAAKTETAAIQRVTLWIDKSGLIPRLAEYVDYNEETSRVRFSDYQFDQAKDRQRFTFAPPEDAEVIVLPLKKSNRNGD